MYVHLGKSIWLLSLGHHDTVRLNAQAIIIQFSFQFHRDIIQSNVYNQVCMRLAITCNLLSEVVKRRFKIEDDISIIEINNPTLIHSPKVNYVRFNELQLCFIIGLSMLCKSRNENQQHSLPLIHFPKVNWILVYEVRTPFITVFFLRHAFRHSYKIGVYYIQIVQLKAYIVKIVCRICIYVLFVVFWCWCYEQMYAE